MWAKIIKTAALLLVWPTLWALVDAFLLRLPPPAGFLTGSVWGFGVIMYAYDWGWLDGWLV